MFREQQILQPEAFRPRLAVAEDIQSIGNPVIMQESPGTINTKPFTESRGGRDFSGVKAYNNGEAEGGPGVAEDKLGGGPLLAQTASPETDQEDAEGSELQQKDKTPAKEEEWVMDGEGSLYYKTKKEADDRMEALQKKGEWREYKVSEFKRGDKTFWRVLMRGKVKPEDKKEPEKKVPEKTPEQEKKKEAEGKDAEKKDKAPALPDPVFALTFDDGPHAAELGTGKNRTENVLDILKAEGIKGAFFIQTGVSFRGASANGKTLVARMVADGHTVGIHTGGTADHELHTEAAKKGTLEAELNAAKTYVNDTTKQPATLVRPPTGAFNADVSKIYAQVGLKNLMWDIDGDEGKNSSLGTLQARLDTGLAEAKTQGWKPWVQKLSSKIVVLYHDIQKGTAESIKTLIKYIRDKVKSLSGGKNTAKFDKP
jgi:peptidoglycan/xylan/chitin deacetylase (PgdA/CDA1 family)